MRIAFRRQFDLLRSTLTGFDAQSIEIKHTCLHRLHGLPLTLDKELITYTETLLFLIAYPGNPGLLTKAESELSRVARFLKQHDPGKRNYFLNSGLPFTTIKTRFTHDNLRWLMAHPDCSVILDGFKDGGLLLNDILKITLPTVERAETTAGLDNYDLMDVLKVPANARLKFLIDEFERLDDQPYTKDLLFERLAPVVCVLPRNKYFSIPYNRLEEKQPFYHHDVLKKIDPRPILDSPVPDAQRLNEHDKKKMIRVVKNAMALTARETDPCTFMDESSFRLYKLERGISISIFSMIPSRQLPLESYVGYTAFKNGLPVSYGGAWVFGQRASFGINIFKPYRSGESAYLMAQLLRLYRQVFNLSYFEVEPYQYGLGNPEGIASGAFWFYYRFGFRPLDRKLRALARLESDKIKRKKNYRTSEKTLTTFTGSNIFLSLDGKTPPKIPDITVRITRMIARSFKNNRSLAEANCVAAFLGKTKMKTPRSEAEKQVLTEVALWAEAMQITDPHSLELMTHMIRTKPRDVFAYQAWLLRFFKDWNGNPDK